MSQAVQGNPFPGLRPYDFEDAQCFFGREGQVDQLLERVRRNRFVAVLGEAGSGKSSLVRAGLVPSLYSGFIPGPRFRWRVAVMRPGSEPISNLARCLADVNLILREDPGRGSVVLGLIEAALRSGSLGLAELVRRSTISPDSLLIVVDQFEELFRFPIWDGRQSTEEPAAFVKLLLNVVSWEVPVHVIVTMRAEFLGDCVQFWGLPEVLNEGLFLVPRMTRDQWRSAIAGPASMSGGEIAPRLMSRLLNDAGDHSTDLGLMQHALGRTWDYWIKWRREGDPIDLDHYESVGGVGAIAIHADEALRDLPPSGQQIAESVFKTLTVRDADNRQQRRPTRFGDLCAISGAAQQDLIAVVETFRREGRAFLTPPSHVPITSDTVIDISYEGLIRHWPSLRHWMDDEAESARTYRRLVETAVLHSKNREGLLQGVGLETTLAWRSAIRPQQTWAHRYHPAFEVAMSFLDRSAANAHKRRIVRRLLWGVVILFMTSIMFGAALYTWNRMRAVDDTRRGSDTHMWISEQVLPWAASYALPTTSWADEVLEFGRTRLIVEALTGIIKNELTNLRQAGESTAYRYPSGCARIA